MDDNSMNGQNGNQGDSQNATQDAPRNEQMNGEMQNGGQMNNMPGNMNGGMQNGNWQPQPQMMRSPKQPMDPAKKKKLILGISLGVGGVIIATIAVVVISMLMKVEYGESYRVAKELKPKISDLNNNYDCSKVVEYVGSTYTKETTYSEYVTGCAGIADGVDELVEKLGQTPGIKRDKELKAQYERFHEAINKVLPDEDELRQRLELYQVWHKFIVMADALSASKSSDAEIQNAAKVLTESGNEILAKYGEGWLEKTMTYVQAYRAYYNGSGSTSGTYAAKSEAESARKNWIAENKPDIAGIGGLSFENASKVYTEFTKLYDKITELYEENYDGSGDCTEFLGEVFCS